MSKAKKLVDKLKKKGVDIRLASDILNPTERISTGSLVLDKAMNGGFPVGKITEIHGENSAGKSLLTLMAMSKVTQEGKYVLHIDAEGNHDSIELAQYRRLFGVDTDFVIQIDRQSAEEIINSTIQVIQDLGPDLKLVVLDSVSALETEKELERKASESSVAEIPRLISRFVWKLNVINKYAAMVVITHLYSQISRVPLPKKAKGGAALNNVAAIRLLVVGRAIPDPDDETAGAVRQEMDIRVVKNKVGPPKKRASVTFDFHTFAFDIAEEILLLGVKRKLIGSRPPYYYFYLKSGEKVISGRAAAKDFLTKNPKLMDKYKKKLLK